MGRRTKAWHMAQASKAEALLAVEFYNTTGERRSLEAFVVHMHLAWLYLLHARLERAGTDYRYWREDANGRRVLERIDGEPKTWDLARCAHERWADGDAVRKNLEFFIGLRNRIEHRYQESIGLAVAGHAQAMVVNYEAELVDAFGAAEGLADKLRFPVFLTSLTPEGVASVKRLRAKIPARTLRYINDFHGGLGAEVASDARFEFRVHLVPQTGPRTDADMALNFISVDDLTAEERAMLERLGQTGLIARHTRDRPVQNLGRHRPAQVVAEVATHIAHFNMADHTAAWKRYRVRPERGATDPAATDERYCVYDEPHDDYIYTDAWIKKLVRDTQRTRPPTS
jgi:Domain of unknown function (DUF3644)